MSGTGSPTEDQQWYVARDGQQHGPLSNAEMRLFVQGGHLKATDLIWKAGFPDWKPAPSVFPPKGDIDDALFGPNRHPSKPDDTVKSFAETATLDPKPSAKDDDHPKTESDNKVVATSAKADEADEKPKQAKKTASSKADKPKSDEPASVAEQKDKKAEPVTTAATAAAKDTTASSKPASGAPKDNPKATKPDTASKDGDAPDNPFDPKTWKQAKAKQAETPEADKPSATQDGERQARQPAAALESGDAPRSGSQNQNTHLSTSTAKDLGQRPAQGGADKLDPRLQRPASQNGSSQTANAQGSHPQATGQPGSARQPHGYNQRPGQNRQSGYAQPGQNQFNAPGQMHPGQQQPGLHQSGQPQHGQRFSGQHPQGQLHPNQLHPGQRHPSQLQPARASADIPTGPVIPVPPQDYEEVSEGRAVLGRIAAVITGIVVLSGLGYVAYDHRAQIANVYDSTLTSIASATDDDDDPGPPVIRSEPVKARSGSAAEVAALDNTLAPPSQTTNDASQSSSGAGTSSGAPVDPMIALDADFEKSQLWSLIKREFPDWYNTRLKEVAEMSANRSETDVSAHLISQLVTLRRSNAKHALAASPEKLERVASAFLANLQSLNTHSTDACFRFISQGESSPQIVKLFPNKPYGPAIEAQIAAIFEAIADGRKTPTTRARAEKPDYDQLAGELGKLGWGQADLKLFADPAALAKAPPERVCKMVQDWFQAHISISDVNVKERLLFETLRPVIAG
ncbi:MAG: GYF domain-containing protein [Pseudomonadota bacterium]